MHIKYKFCHKIISASIFVFVLVSLFTPVLSFAAGTKVKFDVCPAYNPSYSEVTAKYPSPQASITWSYQALTPKSVTTSLLPQNSATCPNGYYNEILIDAPAVSTVNINYLIKSGTTTLYEGSANYAFNTLKTYYAINPEVKAEPASSGTIPGAPLITAERYISGQTFYEGEPFPIRLNLNLLDRNGNDGEERKISYGTISGYSDALDIKGNFVSEASLPDGTYRVWVDEDYKTVMDDWKDTLGDVAAKAACALLGAPGIAYCGYLEAKEAVDEALNGELRLVGSANVVISGGKVSPSPASLVISAVKISPLDKALSGAIKTLASTVATFTKTAVGGINKLLDDTANIVLGDASKATTGVEAAWTKIRNVALTLLIMALIIIAFANVLQIDIEHYGLNRMIPRIIISIIMAYLSWIIVTFFFDFAKALQDQARGLLAQGNGLDALGSISISTPTAGDILSKAGSVIVLIILLIGILICLIMLWFSLLVRVVVLSFLLAVAPLAFILNIVPFTSKLYKQWWSEFFKWMFMGPVAVVIIALGSVIASGSFGFTGSSMNLSGDSVLMVDSTGWNMLIGLLILGASIYFAATLPQKWGGGIMKGWTKAGKWGRDNLLGGNYVKKGWDARKKNVEGLRSQRFNRAFGAVSQWGGVGRALTGNDKIGQKAAYDAMIADTGKRIAPLSKAEKIDRLQSSNVGKIEKIALERDLAASGNYNMGFIDAEGMKYFNKNTGGWMDKTELAENGLTEEAKDAAEKRSIEEAGRHLAGLKGSDAALEKSVLDNQAEIAYAAGAQDDVWGRRLRGAAIAGQSGKSGDQRRPGYIKQLTPSDVAKLPATTVTQGLDGSKASEKSQKAYISKYNDMSPEAKEAVRNSRYFGSLDQEAKNKILGGPTDPSDNYSI